MLAVYWYDARAVLTCDRDDGELPLVTATTTEEGARWMGKSDKRLRAAATEGDGYSFLSALYR
jgi:hypothetical protein